ncbi:MAG: isopentenyl-diphosphate Delta-isomerase [Mesorhizobium sp.]|nr:isopentenyl-diphosphate Delta-isomerase [Mesorhizobium sp.]
MSDSQTIMAADPLIPAIANNGSLFAIGKMHAHEIGQKHLAISAFVFNGDRLLLQRRADCKYHSPGQWANSCCTHPHWGEAVEAAAHRRLGEELGISLPLTHRAIVEYRAEVGHGLIEHEVVHVFEGRLSNASLPADFDRAEVAEVRWATLDELAADIETSPNRYTPWLRIYLKRWSELALHVAA